LPTISYAAVRCTPRNVCVISAKHGLPVCVAAEEREIGSSEAKHRRAMFVRTDSKSKITEIQQYSSSSSDFDFDHRNAPPYRGQSWGAPARLGQLASPVSSSTWWHSSRRHQTAETGRRARQ